MQVSNLTIELTRRCNLSCDHCLRGTAQNCDIDKKHIDAAFQKFDRIYTLCLTGGEPSLVPELIRYVVKQIKKNKVSIGNFNITTNAVKVSNAFISAIMELYLVCEDKECCMLSVSNDGYHADSIEKDLERNYQLLEVFKFTSRRQSKNTNYYHDSIIDQGNGRNWGGKQLDVGTLSINEDNEIEGMIYINALGNVVADCDMSYESQDCEALQVFNIADNVNIKKKIKEYNKRVNKLKNQCGSSNVECIIDYYECYINVEKPEEKAA